MILIAKTTIKYRKDKDKFFSLFSSRLIKTFNETLGIDLVENQKNEFQTSRIRSYFGFDVKKSMIRFTCNKLNITISGNSEVIEVNIKLWYWKKLLLFMIVLGMFFWLNLTILSRGTINNEMLLSFILLGVLGIISLYAFISLLMIKGLIQDTLDKTKKCFYKPSKRPLSLK